MKVDRASMASIDVANLAGASAGISLGGQFYDTVTAGLSIRNCASTGSLDSQKTLNYLSRDREEL
jgi:hypothetical protein